MKKRLLMLGLMAVLAQGAGAWRPAGWVYHQHPWAHDRATGDWYWFNPDTQWVVNMSNGQWARLPSSALATGWVFYNWAYAYAQHNGAWHWINEPDRQWVVNMRTATWSRFGVWAVPAGMVLIPGGTHAGTNPLGAGEAHDPDYYPATYHLTVEPFYMDPYEVTKKQWDDVYTWAIANGYTFQDDLYGLQPGRGKAADHPVHSVNWYDCVKWCNARSQKEGRPAVYTVDGAVYKTGQADNVVQTAAAGYRLPTSDEWEYAARGGAAGRRFPWGDSDEIQHGRANYKSDDSDSYDTSETRGFHPAYETGIMPYTAPAGSFAANGYGLHDMAGNVTEWCFDWHPSYVGSYRVCRGGDWAALAYLCRAGRRGIGHPDGSYSSVGFRSALTPAVAP